MGTPDSDVPLVIIDVQDDFIFDSYVVDGVVERICSAKKDGRPILIVEFLDKGDTKKPIIDAIAGYDRQGWCVKDGMDGSFIVASKLMQEWGISPPSGVEICGIYCAHCVAKTANGMVRKGFSVDIQEGAIDRFGWGATEQIDRWKRSRGKIRISSMGSDLPDIPGEMARHLLRHDARNIMAITRIVARDGVVVGKNNLGVAACGTRRDRPIDKAIEMGLICEKDGWAKVYKPTALGTETLIRIDRIRRGEEKP